MRCLGRGLNSSLAIIFSEGINVEASNTVLHTWPQSTQSQQGECLLGLYSCFDRNPWLIIEVGLPGLEFPVAIETIFSGGINFEAIATQFYIPGLH